MKHLLRGAVLALFLLLGLGVQAKVLVLSTTSSGPAIGLAYDAFANNPVTADLGGIVDGRYRLSSPTAIDPAELDDVQVVVLLTAGLGNQGRIHANHRQLLRDAILGRPDLTFLIFSDGCCHQDSNLKPLLEILDQGTSWGMQASGNIPENIKSRLNTSSLYHADFTALDPMVGRYYATISNVPADNVLYLPDGVTALPPSTTRSSAYGLFIPHARMNGGAGACAFLTADMSEFGDPDLGSLYPKDQPERIAAAFMKAATDPAGACHQSTREPDLSPGITGPAAPAPGVPATYHVTIRNLGASGSTNGQVTLTLPAGLALDPAAALPPGCAAQAPGIVCSDIGALAASSGEVSGSFTVIPDPAFKSGDISVAVSNVTGEVNTSNNTAQLAVATPADLVPSISGPTAPAPGAPATYTVTIANQGGRDSTSGTVTIALPAGMAVDPASLGGLPCTAQAPGIVCTNIGGVPAGGSVTGSFVATAATPLAGPIDVDVTAVQSTGAVPEAITDNNRAQLAVAMPGALGSGTHAVPTLHIWALLLLSGLLPLLMRRRG